MSDFWESQKPWLTVERLRRIFQVTTWIVLAALVFVIAVRV